MNKQFSKMQTFLVIWFGQFVSLSGTEMTRFALLTWTYQQTGQATTLALLGFASFILDILLSPFAGVIIDRYDRRKVLLWSDMGAGILTMCLMALYLTDSLQIWHLFVSATLTGGLDAFQIPAYQAASTVLIPKQHYSRANGLRSLAISASRVGAPFLAGVILALFDLGAVLAIDIMTFLIAMMTLAIVRIPRPVKSDVGHEAGGSTTFQQMRYGLRFIWSRKGLFFMMTQMMAINLIAAITYFGVLPAMILARTGGDELALASVQSALGIGGIVGGVLMTTWGGPKRRIHGVYLAAAVSFLLGDFILGTGQFLPFWIFGAFIAELFVPIILASDRTIWQLKVPPDVQGRVFAVMNMFRISTMPLGYLIAGPLADFVFEPAMMQGGSLADTFGWLVGTGPGAGMGLMFVCTAFLGITISLSGYLIPAVRRIERDLPDYEVIEEQAVVAAEVV